MMQDMRRHAERRRGLTPGASTRWLAGAFYISLVFRPAVPHGCTRKKIFLGAQGNLDVFEKPRGPGLVPAPTWTGSLSLPGSILITSRDKLGPSAPPVSGPCFWRALVSMLPCGLEPSSGLTLFTGFTRDDACQSRLHKEKVKQLNWQKGRATCEPTNSFHAVALIFT